MNIKQELLLFALAVFCWSAIAQPQNAQVEQSSMPRISRGSDVVFGPGKTTEALAGADVGLRFEDAPLGDVLQVILRDVVKVNYVVHPPITGTVTLATQGDVSADYAMLLLEHALQANGLVMARDNRGTYHIGRAEIIKGIVPSVRRADSGSPLPPGTGAIVVPLKYIGAAEMASILKPFAGADSIAKVDNIRNLLVLVGSRAQAEGWLDLVSTFDVDLLKGMSVAVLPLKYISTKDVEYALRILNSLSTGGSAAATPAGATPVPNSAAGGQTAAGAFASPSSYGALRIFPMEAQNSILVVSPRAAYIDEARIWLDKLDKPAGGVNEQTLFFYAVQNGSATHLAEVLIGLYGATSNGAAPTSNSSGVAPGLTPMTVASAAPTSLGQLGGSSATAGKSKVQGAGITAVNLTPSVRIIADEINNAVLVYSSANEFSKVEATLKRLDVPLTQVLIEASIIEITLTDSLKYGLQWLFSESRGSDIATSVLSTAAGAALGSTPAGFSYTLRNSGGDVRAVLNALAEKSLVKVMSSPSLMVLNNHMASIMVGNQQPVQAGQTVTTGGNITNNIQYKDTGVSLSVTPTVNAGNMVTMQINQSVNDVGPVDVATGQRSFLQRQIGSKVAVRSGETLVLGGLIRDNGAKGKSGIPLLQDLPLVGSLFGANTTSQDRTELLVIITPRVVRSDQEIHKASARFRDTMTGLAGTWPNAEEPEPLSRAVVRPQPELPSSGRVQ